MFSYSIIKGLPAQFRVLIPLMFNLFLGLALYRLAFGLGYLLMDELSVAIIKYFPNFGGGGGLGQPPAPSNDSALFPPYQSDEGEEQPADAQREERAKADKEKRRRLNYFPDNRAYSNALNKQDTIQDRMREILKEEGIHLEDEGDLERGVRLYLHDTMHLDPRARSKRLQRILVSLSAKKGKSYYYTRILEKIKSFSNFD